jgi:Zn-dependent peptidase ImmA (M78 family)/DNA-binding XRE family transcriptional regulator
MATFVGARLTEARQAMGLNPTNLANLLGVTRQMIYKYEGEEAAPGQEVFDKICRVLRQPASFFYDPHVNSAFEAERVHFRSNKLKTDERDFTVVRLKWLIEYFGVLMRNLELPQVNLPETHAPEDPTTISKETIEETASRVRRFWKVGDGALPNLVHLLELNGFAIQQFNFGFVKLDGMSYWSTEYHRPFVVLNSDKASCVRSRFDLAHELGHMVLHRNVPPELMTFQIFERMEVQAHGFASALLLPAETWLRDVTACTLGAFRTLKPKWRASIGAMIMRAQSLNLIDENRARGLWKQYSAKRWRAGEPFDDMWELEMPQMFQQATEMLAESELGVSSITGAFPRRPENLSELTGLRPELFTSPPPLPISPFNRHN